MLASFFKTLNILFDVIPAILYFYSSSLKCIFNALRYIWNLLSSFISAVNFYLVVYLVAYPLLRLFITFILVIILQFFFLQHFVNAESIPSSDLSSKEDSSTTSTIYKIGAAVVFVGLTLYFSGGNSDSSSRPSSPSYGSEFDGFEFSSNISDSVLDYACQLVSFAVAGLTAAAIVSSRTTDASLHIGTAELMIDFFKRDLLTGDNAAVITQYKLLATNDDPVLRRGTSENLTVYSEVLKAFVEIARQTTDPLTKSVCGALWDNHMLLDNPNFESNYKSTITRLAKSGVLQSTNEVFEKTVAMGLDPSSSTSAETIKSSTSTSPAVDSSTTPLSASSTMVIPSAQDFLNFFIEQEEKGLVTDIEDLIALIQALLPKSMWNTTYNQISESSPSSLFMDSFDKLIPENKSHYYYLVKIKAAISTYDILVSTGQVDRLELANQLFNAYVKHYADEYFKDVDKR
jgi:hypothetical protein